MYFKDIDLFTPQLLYYLIKLFMISNTKNIYQGKVIQLSAVYKIHLIPYLAALNKYKSSGK